MESNQKYAFQNVPENHTHLNIVRVLVYKLFSRNWLEHDSNFFHEFLEFAENKNLKI